MSSINNKSIVKDAEIYLDDKFLTKTESDNLLKILNDDNKFKYYNLYFYNQKTKKIDAVKNHRKSYWFGDYAQSVQRTRNVIDKDTGKKIEMPCDYVKAYKFPKEIFELKNRIEKLYNIKFNSCLVGKYDSPKDKIGFHSDSSTGLGINPFIGSVSFNNPREFRLKKKREYCRENEVENVNVVLNHGTLLVMRDNANVKYLHSVPVDKTCSKEHYRINLTFRLYKYSEEEKKYPY